MVFTNSIRIFLTGLLIFFFNVSFAQLKLDTLGWIPPVDIPIYLSGNFAELRTGHFHAGIDIKTQGKEGFKVYAVQDGYISRIKISTGGYGKAIYINHIDGYTSVYGHLKEFNIQLEKYVRKKQYANESYEVDIFPDKGELLVSKGDIIGLSGNSGGSSGPHLHFEVRDTKSSRPMNGLFLGFDIQDDIPPKMFYLYVYPKSKNSHVNSNIADHFYSLKKLNGHYQLRQGDTLNAYGKIGLGLKVNDYLNGSANRCGVYQLKVFVNNELYFYNKFDGFSFYESRYINSLMDYKENVEKKRKLHKLFIDPNNNLSVYVDSKNNGVIDIKTNEFYNVRIEAIDAQMNESSLGFTILGTKPEMVNLEVDNSKITVPWEYPFSLDTMGLSVSIPDKSFYDTVNLEFYIDTTRFENTYSNIYHLHNRYIPVHKRFNISIEFDLIADSLRNRLLIAQIKGDHFKPNGGKLYGNSIVSSVRELGSYVVTIDTTPPVIKPLGSLLHTKNLTNQQSLRFVLTDDLSGIDVYRGFVNGHWVLFEWDSKNNLLQYNFDEFMPLEGTIEIRLEVWDERGNFSLYKTTCVRNTL